MNRGVGIGTIIGLLICGGATNAQQIAYAKSDVSIKEESPEKVVFRDEISSFIINTAIARVICAEEGRLASEKATTKDIRRYGEMMIKDQGRLLGELKRLAVLNDVVIPNNTYEIYLDQKSGRQFNHAFIRNMIMEHERDIKIFKKATFSTDPEIAAFATRYLPLIESHLEMIKDIKR